MNKIMIGETQENDSDGPERVREPDLELALVFDKEGNTIAWHEPEGRTSCFIPDSDAHWDSLWDNRHRLGGTAHIHPWDGKAHPSFIDLTTWAAFEGGLGRRTWVIVTYTDEVHYRWVGPGRLDYAGLSIPTVRVDAEGLREKSRRCSNG